MIFRAIGSTGPQVVTQAQATAMATLYSDSIPPGNEIRISDVGSAPGTIYVWNGSTWISEASGGMTGNYFL